MLLVRRSLINTAKDKNPCPPRARHLLPGKNARMETIYAASKTQIFLQPSAGAALYTQWDRPPNPDRCKCHGSAQPSS